MVPLLLLPCCSLLIAPSLLLIAPSLLLIACGVWRVTCGVRLKAKSALSALETFAMERDDEVTRFSHEKEELLEELKGARSGQDRSNEEVNVLVIEENLPVGI